MPLVVVSSPKGGVGKTTVAANLGMALTTLGYRVVAIDFDVQNALRLHFGMPIEDGRGYAAGAVDHPDWSKSLLKSASGVFFLPYGTVDHDQRRRFTDAIAQGGGAFIAARLKTILNRSDCIVIADTPPGPGPVIDALDDIADFRIIVLLTDAASLSQLPTIEDGRFFANLKAPNRPLRLVLNQVDLRRPLSRDITAFLRARAGNALLGTIRQDEAMAESVANQQSILEYAPHSGAALDLKALARQLDDGLFASKHKRAAAKP